MKIVSNIFKSEVNTGQRVQKFRRIDVQNQGQSQAASSSVDPCVSRFMPI